MSTKFSRPLDPAEVRVLGALLEKEQTTPEAYPLSLNALVAACNQRTGREPVMQLDEAEVAGALDRLRQEVLVWRSEGSRVPRWRQSVERRWQLDPAAKAILTLLLLRGAQTAGELRARSERMHRFAELADVEEVLGRLAAEDEPLVRELPRRPGQKETRWVHLVGAPVASPAASDAPGSPATSGAPGHRQASPAGARPAAPAAPASPTARPFHVHAAPPDAAWPRATPPDPTAPRATPPDAAALRSAPSDPTTRRAAPPDAAGLRSALPDPTAPRAAPHDVAALGARVADLERTVAGLSRQLAELLRRLG
jgi:uncharacterized protein YceH (UPF0502 family)